MIKRTLRDNFLILLAPVLLIGPLLVRGQVLFWGTPSLQFVAWWVAAWNSLRQGALPLWNPLNGMGAPLLASYQPGLLYPPNWILLLLAALGGADHAAAAIAAGYTVLAMLHLAWGGLGMVALLRRLGFHRLGQQLGGLAFALSGYLVGRLGFFSMVWAAAWLPWVLYFADQIGSPAGEETQDKLHFQFIPGLAGCIAMQLLAGHAQLTWYTLLLAGAWVLVGALRAGGFRRTFWALLSFGAAGLVAAGLSAAQLIPTFEYLRLSPRADAFAYTEAMTYSFYPWRVLTLFSPDFFGSPARGDFWGYASYWEDHLYAGLLPLLLALATLFLLARGVRRARRDRRWGLLVFLWALIGLSFLLALGSNTPVFPFLYHTIPTFSMFQAPARWLIWAAFAIPLLAAVGVEHWRCPTGRGLYWFRLGTMGAFAITAGAGLAYLLMPNIRLTFVRAAALTGMWALGVGLLTLAIPLAEKHHRRAWWQSAVLAWTLLDLLVAGWGLNPGVSLDFYAGKSTAAERLLSLPQGQRVYLSKSEEYDLKFRRFLRFADFTPLEDWRALRDTLIPNLNLLDGIPSANNFDPLVPGDYALWMADLDALSPQARQGWLALMNVGAVEHIDVSQPGGVRFDPVAGAQRWRWYGCIIESFCPGWGEVSEEMQSSPRPERTVVVSYPPHLDQDCDPDGTAIVRPISERPDKITVEVQVKSQNTGWLVMADTWYPGWHAVVDGKVVPIYRADSIFRAVPLRSGIHQVVIEYRPIGFYFGASFSILVLLLMLYYLTRSGRFSDKSCLSQ